MGRNLIETIMGAVVLLVAGVFLAFAYSFTHVQTGGGYLVMAHFNAVDGLNPGGDVRIGGVKVGSVVSQVIDMEEYRAAVTMTVQSNVKIPVDSKVSITSAGLLSDKYVKIEPGTAQELVAPGGLLTNTKDVLLVEELLGRAIFLLTEE